MRRSSTVPEPPATTGHEPASRGHGAPEPNAIALVAKPNEGLPSTKRAAKYRWLARTAPEPPVQLSEGADSSPKAPAVNEPEMLKRHVVHVQRVSHYEYIVEYVYPDEPSPHRD